MIDVKLIKLSCRYCANNSCKPQCTTAIPCSNSLCDKDDKFIYHQVFKSPMINSPFWIKPNTIAVQIIMGKCIEYFCQPCAKVISSLVKSKLDPKLWVFH